MSTAVQAAGHALKTARLRLKPLFADDVAPFHALMIEPDVRRYLLDGEIMPREWAENVVADNAATFAAEGWGLWGARLGPAPALIGIAGFREFFEPPETQLLYAFHPDYWGQGFATEAAAAVMRYGFERLGMARILACTDVPNRASVAVMQRLGLHCLGNAVRDGREVIYFGVEAADWRRRAGALP